MRVIIAVIHQFSFQTFGLMAYLVISQGMVIQKTSAQGVSVIELELTAHHGPDWNRLLAKKLVTPEEIKNHLRSVVTDQVQASTSSSNPSFSSESFSKKLLLKRAVAEYGHFVTETDEGQFEDDDKNFYQYVEDSVEKFPRLKTALGHSLAVSGTVAGAKKLTEFYKKADGIDKKMFFNMLELNINGAQKPSIQTRGLASYNPNIAVSGINRGFQKTGRVNSKAWRKNWTAVVAELEGATIQSKDAYFRQRYSRFKARQLQKANSEKNSYRKTSSYQKLKQNIGKLKPQGRVPNSDETLKKGGESPTGTGETWFGIALLFILGLGVGFFLKWRGGRKQ